MPLKRQNLQQKMINNPNKKKKRKRLLRRAKNNPLKEKLKELSSKYKSMKVMKI